MEGRRSRRCTESVVASCVSVADQNIGINKPKPSDSSRQDKMRQASEVRFTYTSLHLINCNISSTTSRVVVASSIFLHRNFMVALNCPAYWNCMSGRQPAILQH